MSGWRSGCGWVFSHEKRPTEDVIPHPITPIKRCLIGDRTLHRPPRQGVIDDRAGDAAGLHVGDIFPAGGLVGATA